MKKEYILGGLALVGAIAVVAYLFKPKTTKKNSDGFFNASGVRGTATSGCSICKTGNGGHYYANANDFRCFKGDTCVKSVVRSLSSN